MSRGSYAFGLEAGGHGERELSVTRFVGTEALSEPYLFEVDFFPVSGEPLHLEQVLDAGKITQRWEVRGSYPKRECTAQYREPDLAFLSRVLEQEGIWYRFEEGEGGCTMVVGGGGRGFAQAGRLWYRQKDAAAGEGPPHRPAG